MIPEGIPRPAIEEEFQSILDAGYDTIAVASQPWSGRSQLLDGAAQSLDTDLICVSPGTCDEGSFSLQTDGPVVLDNCQHLFQRRIGGFDTLETLTEDLLGKEGPVVLGWNSFAWQYLAEVTDIQRAVDTVYSIDPMDADAAESFLRETLGVSNPEKALSEAADAHLAERAEADRTSSETALETTGGTLARLRTAVRNRYRGSVVESHLEGLVSDTAGNPTAISHLFQARTDPEADGSPNGFDLSYDETYVLWLVFAAGETTPAALHETTAENVALALSRLERQDIIERSDGLLSVRPLAFGAVHTELSRRRLLW